MKANLKVTALQVNLVWENAVQNRINLEEKIMGLEETDIVVMPEMFTTGFSMKPEGLAETINGDTVVWMKEMALKKNSAICGSIIIEEEKEYYNRFLFVTPLGDIYHYDKRHLFTLAGEHHEYRAGIKKQIILYKGWRICPMICYDLRFPVWARNTESYDLLIYVANWPKPRINAWNALLQARAIENMCYVVGVNRVGIDLNGHEYIGSSKIFGPLGESLANIPEGKEITQTVTLDYDNLQDIRNKFNFLNDKDIFKII